MSIEILSTYKILCPVCNDNIILTNFKEHMNSDDIHKEFVKSAQITDNTYLTLIKSTELKNVRNNIYYNWNYHIQTKYRPDEEDKSTFQVLKTQYPKSEIARKMINVGYNNSILRYQIPILVENIVRILIDEES